MKKRINIALILGILLVASLIFTIVFYIQDKNSKLEIDRLMQENEDLQGEIVQLNDDLGIAIENLDMLKKDVEKIYKTCITGETACKGRFPLVSWRCNVVGDEVSDASHICFCDASCELNATQII